MGRSVCIIGAGLSGLTCAMKLSKKGFDVTVVEEMTYAGGLLATTRIGKESLELLPHHLRKTDKNLLALVKSLGLDTEIDWNDSRWHGKVAHKKVGYFRGGFARLINGLMQEVTDNGGRVYLSTTVADITQIRKEDGSICYRTDCVLSNASKYEVISDYVIFTGSCRTFVNISHNLPISIDDRDSLMNVMYKSQITIMLNLKHIGTEVYYQEFEDQPFVRIVNHSNVFGDRGYGGHIVYLVGYANVTDPLWIASDSKIMEVYFNAFRKIYPGIRKADLKGWRLTKTRYAQSIKYPCTDLHNPCQNLYVCASGIARYGTNEEPLNRMDRVVELVGKICDEISVSAEGKQETVTPLYSSHSRESELV
ncbi:MAG: FAD-dependent oxidoreductase [Clostridiales bacterium]|jgi:protoporphyrinogen oxidase|nr:FAD-dependent oxidoreductase [Clostridiales bacterium]